MDDGLRVGFEIIETLRYDPEAGPVRGRRHLARMAGSAAELGVAFDAERAWAMLLAVRADQALRLRLTVTAAGELALSQSPMPPVARLWRFRLAKPRLDPADPWLYHKTSRRALYDQLRAEMPEGVEELVCLNLHGRLCEGTISNLFVERKGRLLTPPRAAGLLPGVLRGELIAQGWAEEADLGPADLDGAERIYLGNSLRGLIPAERV